MTEKRAFFPSKIILFGEYLVLFGGDALAIPLDTFSMQIVEKSQEQHKHIIAEFTNYLEYIPLFKNRIEKQKIHAFFESNRIESTIPIGYGLGSSGALVACFYELFIENKKQYLEDIRAELAIMEQFFHEKSSGLDPLTSYIQQPILIQNQTPSEIILQSHVLEPFSIFDSGIERKAHEAIHIFKELMQQDAFQKNIKEKMLPINQSIIQKMMVGKDVQEEVKILSYLQFKLFEALIPHSVKDIWQKGLDTNTYFMKLCGAGKGGYFLIYSTEKEPVAGSFKII